MRETNLKLHLSDGVRCCFCSKSHDHPMFVSVRNIVDYRFHLGEMHTGLILIPCIDESHYLFKHKEIK